MHIGSRVNDTLSQAIGLEDELHWKRNLPLQMYFLSFWSQTKLVVSPIPLLDKKIDDLMS